MRVSLTKMFIVSALKVYTLVVCLLERGASSILVKRTSTLLTVNDKITGDMYISNLRAPFRKVSDLTSRCDYFTSCPLH